MRLGINRTWDSRWFARQGNYGKLLHEDHASIRDLSDEGKLGKAASVAKIVIERPAKKSRALPFYSARPGVIIGKKGADIEKMRAEIGEDDQRPKSALNIVEIRKPDIDAQAGRQPASPTSWNAASASAAR